MVPESWDVGALAWGAPVLSADQGQGQVLRELQAPANVAQPADPQQPVRFPGSV